MSGRPNPNFNSDVIERSHMGAVINQISAAISILEMSSWQKKELADYWKGQLEQVRSEIGEFFNEDDAL